MARYIRFVLLLMLGMFAWVAVGSADVIHTVTIGVPLNGLSEGQQPCPGCSFTPGLDGSPASGGANFNSIGLPWAFDFITGNATSFIFSAPEFGPTQYEAFFGSGGSFTMTGPSGLTFTGEVTSGSSFFSSSHEQSGVDVDYSGIWSDGVPGVGVASFENPPVPPTDGVTLVYFTAAVPVLTPEPSSFMLLGTGAIGLCVLVRRRCRG